MLFVKTVYIKYNTFSFQLGYTALHRAAAQGHLEVIKVLLVEGCLVDVQDEVVMLILA